jgi:RND family efflux transporter MFP subunit
MKRWWKWMVALLVILVLAAVVGRALVARKAQQQALTAAGAAKAVTVVELAASDVARAQTRELAQGLPITGALKAVNSAFLKARVAGELQGLTVREGDTVQAGQVIARIEATEYRSRLRQAQDQADAARAQIDIAQRQFDNNKALVDQGFISKTALDTSVASLNAARATHQAALAAADVARKTLDDAVLKAPIAGMVAQRLAQPGERVAIDARIIEIVDLGRMELEAAVSAGDALQVRVGQTALLRIEGSNAPVKARVARINPSAQAGSRNVLVYLAVEPGPALRQGLFAEGTLGTERLNVLAVPLRALRTDKPAPYVQAIERDQIVHKPVVAGARGDVAGEAMVAVTGLAENALVVTGAVGTLREGTAVKFTALKPAVAASAPTPAR